MVLIIETGSYVLFAKVTFVRNRLKVSSVHKIQNAGSQYHKLQSCLKYFPKTEVTIG